MLRTRVVATLHCSSGRHDIAYISARCHKDTVGFRPIFTLLPRSFLNFMDKCGDLSSSLNPYLWSLSSGRLKAFRANRILSEIVVPDEPATPRLVNGQVVVQQLQRRSSLAVPSKMSAARSSSRIVLAALSFLHYVDRFLQPVVGVWDFRHGSGRAGTCSRGFEREIASRGLRFAVRQPVFQLRISPRPNPSDVQRSAGQPHLMNIVRRMVSVGILYRFFDDFKQPCPRQGCFLKHSSVHLFVTDHVQIAGRPI